MRMRAVSRKPLIFVVILFLVVILVYASSTTSIVFSVPPDVFWSIGGADCFNDIGLPLTRTCCWEEYTPEGDALRNCQTCILDLVTEEWDCTPVYPEEGAPPPPPQPIGPSVPLQDGVLQQQPPSEEGGVGAQPLTRSEDVLPPEDQGVPDTPTGEEAESRIPFSPSGGCISSIRTHCVPCDPGLPTTGCTPESEWSPVSGPLVEETVPEAEQPSTDDAPLSAPLVEETVPEAEQPSADKATEQTSIEALPTCPEGQVLDEVSGLCVFEEPTQPEADEPEVDEELPVEEDNSNN